MTSLEIRPAAQTPRACSPSASAPRGFRKGLTTGVAVMDRTSFLAVSVLKDTYATRRAPRATSRR